jgi:ABC-type Fe3+ transport system substrate-binding protein
MTFSKKALPGALAAAVIAITAASGATPAAAQSANEKLYAELAKLPEAERTQRLIEGARKEGQLNFIHGLRGRLGQNWMKIFQERYPTLKTEISEAGSQDIADRMVSEHIAGRPLTDAFSIASADGEAVIRHKVYEINPSPVVKKVDQKWSGFVDPDNRWIPYLWSEHAITYNPTMVKPEDAPKSWEGLCDERYRGQMSFDPGETRFMSGLLKILGSMEKLDKWLECIGKLEPIIMRGHTVRLNLMMAGDHAIAPDQYAYQGTLLNQKNPKKAPFQVAYSAPLMGYSLWMQVRSGTPHPYGAALICDWTLSLESQEYVSSEYRSPLVVKHPYLPDDATLVVYEYDSKETIDKMFDIWNKHMGGKR